MLSSSPSLPIKNHNDKIQKKKKCQEKKYSKKVEIGLQPIALTKKIT